LPADSLNAVEWHDHSWSPKPLSLRPGTLKASLDPFCDPIAFELTDGRQHVELQPTGWRGRVDALAEGDESDPE